MCDFDCDGIPYRKRNLDWIEYRAVPATIGIYTGRWDDHYSNLWVGWSPQFPHKWVYGETEREAYRNIRRLIHGHLTQRTWKVSSTIPGVST